MDSGGRQMRLVGLELVELRQALAAERAERKAIDRRLAETAHDLRASLASIVGYAHMLADGEDHAFTPKQIAQRIGRLAETLCEISSDLIGPDGRPIETGRSGSVRALLAQCAEAIEPLCREKGLALHLDLPPVSESITDGASLQRIVHNLLTNAVRYTERGAVRLGGELGRDGLSIEVCDTGIGIARESLGRIFDDYTRLDDARRLAPLGTGLGLATVKRLCERLGGRVEVESTLGAGSVFRVVLPRRARRRRARQAMVQAALW